MNKDLAAAWKKAEESGEKIPIGNIVVCDQCDIDYTSRDDRGGIILGSNAFCPSCTPKMLADVARHREEHYIRARCQRDRVLFRDVARPPAWVFVMIAAVIGVVYIALILLIQMLLQ